MERPPRGGPTKIQSGVLIRRGDRQQLTRAALANEEPRDIARGFVAEDVLSRVQKSKGHATQGSGEGFCQATSQDTASINWTRYAGSLTKPFSRGQETGLKQRSGPLISIQQRGSIMWDIIISLFYRQICRTSLSAIRMQNHLWA
jgi:hypothetical protein